ncbi:sensor histidine kinase [Phenylobacterium montanum]|uniref:histidine kinase n=1 Tax=Phenylobacterium montanum TaxID=2823693 RepID=A0A975ISU2_9CAUL|nr:HAMP domain-containing sensor histidine kinase [Caulobacter sp. S6]QUD86088.1 HAMP domain-containing histidine kinase [Caulobacter sp. S6]
MTGETMTGETRPRIPGQLGAAELRDILWWHAGWTGAAAAESIVLLVAARAPGNLVLALVAGSLPALGALMLMRLTERPARFPLLILWAMGACSAAGLSGGLTGPLGVWGLMPLAAAIALGGPRRVAQGAALSVLTLALNALVQVMGLAAPTPPLSIGFSLGLFGLASVLFGLGGGIMLDRRRSARGLESEIIGRHALEAILSSQPQLVLWLNTAGKVSAAYGEAPAAISLGQLRREGLASLVDPAHWPDVLFVLSEAADRRGGEITFPMAGAERVWLSLEARELAGSGVVAVLRDVTAQREHLAGLERARQDAESLNIGKSRFLANMSHELRTPLNAIMGFSDIMRARLFGALPGKYVEYADLIHDAGSHLLDLINDVLDMSKIEAARYELHIERLDAREPVAAALRLMRVQADDVGVKLRGVLPSDAIEVDADRRAIKQIGLNLISNALKFTPRGGLVTVTLSRLAGALELTVTDTGVGIARADLERLGRPFEQAGDAGQQAKGTGLGLSLVRAFAELHGGEMSIESQLGEGTAVTVRMPVLTRAGVDPAAAAAELAGAGAPIFGAEDSDPGGAQVIPFKPQR